MSEDETLSAIGHEDFSQGGNFFKSQESCTHQLPADKILGTFYA